MTINELKNDVAQLGFERYVEDEECFIASANRALSLIYVDRPVTKTAKLSFKGPRVSTLREFIEHRSGEEITIPFTGKSVSFRSSGTGNCTVRDALGTSYVSLTNDGQLTKMLVKGEGTITFSGDFYFTVTHEIRNDGLRRTLYHQLSRHRSFPRSRSGTHRMYHLRFFRRHLLARHILPRYGKCQIRRNHHVCSACTIGRPRMLLRPLRRRTHGCRFRRRPAIRNPLLRHLPHYLALLSVLFEARKEILVKPKTPLHIAEAFIFLSQA